MLMPLAERGINLSKVESRPSKRRPERMSVICSINTVACCPASLGYAPLLDPVAPRLWQPWQA